MLSSSGFLMTTKLSALRYSPKAPNRSTVRRQYAAWRKERGIPERCDNSACQFHTAPLVWNDDRLPLILDHVEGNKYENDPQYLRYLCPNCNAQLDTAGGLNQGRVTDLTKGGYTVNLGGGRKIIAATVSPVVITPEMLNRLREIFPEEWARAAAAQQVEQVDDPA